MKCLELNRCCRSCKSKFLIENVAKVPSKHILMEANPRHRLTACSDLEMKVSVWGDASPPLLREESKYSIDLLALEKANALRMGKIFLTKTLNIEPIKSFGEDEEEYNFDDENIDDDYDSSSTLT